MELLIGNVLWAVVAYFIVRRFNDKYPNLDAEPMMYVAGSLLLGFLWVMIYFAYKVNEHKKYGKYSKR